MVLFPRNVMSSGASMMLNEVDVIKVKKNDLHHTRSSAVPTEVGQMAASLHFFCVAMMLRSISSSKGTTLSRNNEVLLLTLNGVVGSIDACEDIKVEILELKCGGKIWYIQHWVTYLCIYC